MASSSRLVLDTSAILALRSDETGARRVEAVLRSARSGRARVYLSFMTRMELLYRIARDEGQEQAEAAVRLIDATGVQWVSCEPEILEEAARIKAAVGRGRVDRRHRARARRGSHPQGPGVQPRRPRTTGEAASVIGRPPPAEHQDPRQRSVRRSASLLRFTVRARPWMIALPPVGRARTRTAASAVHAPPAIAG